MSSAPLVLCVAFVLAIALAASAETRSTGAMVKEVVYYLGDPQIGFSGNATLDTLRFGMAAAAARADPNRVATVVAGDLVNVWNDTSQIAGYKTVWHADETAWWQVPGNHDVNSESTSVDGALAALAHYHDVFGAHDYSNATTRWTSLIMVNSEMLILPYLGLNGTTDPRILEPVEAQWAWLESQLQHAKAAAAQRPHVVLVMHHPPFLATENEPHQYYNMPMVPRSRLLALARKYGAKTVLAGHTHTTRNCTTADGSITIFTTAGTARAFDHRGCGYRTLTATQDSLVVDYIELPHGGGTPGCTP
jgi:3',5'-cyclic AMP phosphodiesterase CpdA